MVKSYLQHLSEISLTDTVAIKLLCDLNEYPALRTAIYPQLVLNYKTEFNKATPSQDKYTDSVQLIESSYCSAIISHDNYFINILAKNLNPYIQSKSIEELI